MKFKSNPKRILVNVWIHNYGEKETSYTTIVEKDVLKQYKDIIKVIKERGHKNTWNWWKHLPEVWNSKTSKYELNTSVIETAFGINFDYPMISVDEIIGFFKTFTPNGADKVYGVSVYECKEIDI